MSKNKKRIPVPEPESEEEYLFPSASWGDMTGLIPFAAEDNAQRLAYEETHLYTPENGGEKK